jgi:mRNA-degrading endonuclease toxin of MazEF toxin-antitoxin module
MGSSDLPQAGELWLVRFGSAEPGEPSKNRPAIVLSDAVMLTGSVFDLVIVVPVSSSVTPALSRPALPPCGGLDAPSVAVPRAIRAVAIGRLLRRLGAVPDETVIAIRRVAADLIGLTAGD